MPTEFSKKHKRLTVAEVRRNYWNKKTKRGKKITIKAGQDLGSYDFGQGYDVMYFTPDGNLLEKGPKGEILHKDWLSTSRSGPYKRSEGGKSNPIFYYLTGKMIKFDDVDLQICSGPLNTLSLDCMDEIGCWIKK